MLHIVHNSVKKLSAKQREEKEIETMKKLILESERGEMTLEESLEKFRLNFPLTAKINVQDDCINYSFNNFGSATDWVKKAENIIRTFNLPLIASAWSGDPRRAVLTIESHHKK